MGTGHAQCWSPSSLLKSSESGCRDTSSYFLVSFCIHHHIDPGILQEGRDVLVFPQHRRGNKSPDRGNILPKATKLLADLHQKLRVLVPSANAGLAGRSQGLSLLLPATPYMWLFLSGPCPHSSTLLVALTWRRRGTNRKLVTDLLC